MRKKRKWVHRLCALTAILAVYPVCVLAFVWSHVLGSDLKGGGNGQLDAYRHALASATVSHTLGEWAVDLVTFVFEWKDKDTNLMDRHNNRVGAKIGSAVGSFREIEPAVLSAVRKGAVGASNPEQITWLPEKRWRDRRLW